MRSYELMYILSPNLEEDAVGELVAKFEEIVTSRGGEVEKTEPMGKRRLAYEINGIREGFYVLSNFKCPVDTAGELERIMKISDHVVRYLLTKVED
jgi:small subunit ribosomal protein S6